MNGIPTGTLVAVALVSSGTAQVGCTSPQDRPTNPPKRVDRTGTDTESAGTGKFKIEILQRGLGPRKPLSPPLPAQAYEFSFRIIQTRKHHKNQVSIEGTLGTISAPDNDARTAQLVVTKLRSVRPASLSRLLLKKIVGRSLASLSKTLSKGACLTPDTTLPKGPVGPGAKWKITESLVPSEKELHLVMTADVSMEQSGKAVLIKQSSVLTCARDRPLSCHGRGRASWKIIDGRTMSARSTVELVLGKGPGQVTETQVFEATALEEKGTLPRKAALFGRNRKW